MLRLFAFLGLCSLLSACFPYRYTDRPGVVGSVVSGIDGSVIQGAKVRLTFAHPAVSFAPSEVTASSEGTFQAPPKTFWGVYFIPQEPGPPGVCTVTVIADGFEEQTIEFRWWLSGPSVKNLGRVVLNSPQIPGDSVERPLKD